LRLDGALAIFGPLEPIRDEVHDATASGVPLFEDSKPEALGLGDPISRIAAAIKLPVVIVVIREEPVGGAT
jgi:hypothetical protein